MFAHDQIPTDWEESGQTPANVLVVRDRFAESQLPHTQSCLFLFPLGLTRHRTCSPCFSSVPATGSLPGFKSLKGGEVGLRTVGLGGAAILLRDRGDLTFPAGFRILTELILNKGHEKN